MNKPISKHALRRALEKMAREGYVQMSEPMGSFIDRLWHEMEKRNYNASRKKPAMRDSLREMPARPSVDG
ncbi:MAG TPA: hypothetical protein VFL93_12740 [Longimicrobiaceae bacterium]|nr:hypothetical protein [Longimicrobiaceae bacterium]